LGRQRSGVGAGGRRDGDRGQTPKSMERGVVNSLKERCCLCAKMGDVWVKVIRSLGRPTKGGEKASGLLKEKHMGGPHISSAADADSATPT